MRAMCTSVRGLGDAQRRWSEAPARTNAARRPWLREWTLLATEPLRALRMSVGVCGFCGNGGIGTGRAQR